MPIHRVQGTEQQTFRVIGPDISTGSFSLVAPQAASPAGNDAPGTTVDDAMSLDNAALIFFGTGSATQTATAKVVGWRQLPAASGANGLWIPIELMALNLTLGTQTGVSGCVVDNTHLFVTTITASTAYTAANEIISPGDNTPSLVKVDTFGCQYVQVQLAVGTCSSINAMMAQF